MTARNDGDMTTTLDLHPVKTLQGEDRAGPADPYDRNLPQVAVRDTTQRAAGPSRAHELLGQPDS